MQRIPPNQNEYIENESQESKNQAKNFFIKCQGAIELMEQLIDEDKSSNSQIKNNIKDDYVRIKKDKSVFEKGEGLFSDEVYKVVDMKTYGTIKLEDSDGNIMPRTYKNYQLLYVGI